MDRKKPFDLKQSFEDLRKNWEEIKHLDIKTLDEQVREQFIWLQQKYHPAKLLTFVGILVIGFGMVGTGLAVALLVHLFSEHTIWTLITKERFSLMVSILRLGLFMWIFLTGFGVVTRQRWAGVSCMIGYILVESQSVYISEYFLLSVAFSLIAFFACFVVQFHWEVLMSKKEKDIPMECNHQNLLAKSQEFNYWGFYTYCPECHKRIYFYDNMLSTSFLLIFSLGWAMWWYWPLWPLF